MIDGYTSCHLYIGDKKIIEAGDDLDAHIRCFAPQDGWLARQSAVSRWSASGGEWRDDAGDGAILDGELFKDGETLIIRRAAAGWIVTCLCEREAGEHLYDTLFYVSVHHGLMAYRRYWREEEGVIAPFAYRLAGFTDTPVAARNGEAADAA